MSIYLKICTVGEPILRRETVPVTLFDSSLEELAHQMTETMYHANGIGIAAPQVGSNLSLCVVDVSPCLDKVMYCELDKKKQHVQDLSPLVVINPTIIKYSKATSICSEGCLSVPNVQKEVERPNSIRVEFFDLHNTRHLLQCNGLFARCLQHEIDHLHGILFIDKVVPEQQ